MYVAYVCYKNIISGRTLKSKFGVCYFQRQSSNDHLPNYVCTLFDYLPVYCIVNFG